MTWLEIAAEILALAAFLAMVGLLLTVLPAFQ